MSKTFDESKHPRDKLGRWSEVLDAPLSHKESKRLVKLVKRHGDKHKENIEKFIRHQRLPRHLKSKTQRQAELIHKTQKVARGVVGAGAFASVLYGAHLLAPKVRKVHRAVVKTKLERAARRAHYESLGKIGKAIYRTKRAAAAAKTTFKVGKAAVKYGVKGASKLYSAVEYGSDFLRNLKS